MTPGGDIARLRVPRIATGAVTIASVGPGAAHTRRSPHLQTTEVCP